MNTNDIRNDREYRSHKTDFFSNQLVEFVSKGCIDVDRNVIRSETILHVISMNNSDLNKSIIPYKVLKSEMQMKREIFRNTIWFFIFVS